MAENCKLADLIECQIQRLPIYPNLDLAYTDGRWPGCQLVYRSRPDRP